MKVLLAIFICWIAAPSCTAQMYARKEVGSMSPQEVADLKKGISTMMSRPCNNPTSWCYQANIHGTYDQTQNNAWNTCQHGSWFFFCWHRMYIYFFERILRAACGNSSFALPYWGSSENPSLPYIYRQPANPSVNPLYTSQRCSSCNAGNPLPAQVVSSTNAMRYKIFSSSDPNVQSFGGAQDPPTHTGSDGGAFETSCHNAIHSYIGGNNGLMGDPNTAAKDPMFWGHHCNVDRWWVKWIALGNTNPANDYWDSQKFSFFDETQTAVTMQCSQVRNTQSLGYVYLDPPKQKRRKREAGDEPKSKRSNGYGSRGRPQGPLSVFTSMVSTVRHFSRYGLSRTRQKVPERVPYPVATTLESYVERTYSYNSRKLGSFLRKLGKAGEPRALYNAVSHHTILVDRKTFTERQPPGPGTKRCNLIKFTGVDYKKGAMYEVYMNVPPGETPKPLGDNYVGIVAPFANRAHGSDYSKPANSTMYVDASHVVSAMDENNSWPDGYVNVTMVSASCGSEAGTSQDDSLPGESKFSYEGVHLTETDILNYYEL